MTPCNMSHERNGMIQSLALLLLVLLSLAILNGMGALRSGGPPASRAVTSSHWAYETQTVSVGHEQLFVPQLTVEMWADSARAEFTLAGLGELEVGTHAFERHGQEASDALAAILAEAERCPELFDQPPCKDGRWRIVTPTSSSQRVALGVVERVKPGWVKLVTCFLVHLDNKTGRDYLDTVRERCGNGPWFGHSYPRGAPA